MESERCQTCDCPNQHCACVLRERLCSAERERDGAMRERAHWYTMFQATASIVAHSRDRLRKPRGEDERRVLEWIDEAGAAGLGPFWSGRTDGWIK